MNTNAIPRRTRHLAAAAALALLTLSACGSDDADSSSDEAAEVADGTITVTGAVSREPAAGQMVTAVYGDVNNGLDTDIEIIGVSSPVTDNAQLHETSMGDDGAMSMAQVESFTVPAGETFSFESGGPHIMLMDIDPESYPSDEVEVTLEFDGADPLTFLAGVTSLTGDDEMDDMDHENMDDMDHDEMDEMDDSEG